MLGSTLGAWSVCLRRSPSDRTEFIIVIRNIVNFLPVAPDKVLEDKSEAWLNEHTVELKPLIDRISAKELFEVVATPQRMRNLLRPLEKFRKQGGRVNGFGYYEEMIEPFIASCSSTMTRVCRRYSHGSDETQRN